MLDDSANPATLASNSDRGSAVLARASRRTHFTRAALVGLCAGLLGVAFRRSLALAEKGRGQLMGVLHGHPRWGWVVMPVIGLCAGALVGWMTTRFADEAAGSGVPHLKGVLIQVRPLPWRRLVPGQFFVRVVGIGAG